MKKLSSFFKRPDIFSCAVTMALIFLCFFIFRKQVDYYIEEDMHSQIEAVQNNSIQLIQKEMNYLERLTASGAMMLSRAQIRTDKDILQALEDYADTANIVRAIFVTLDGRAYTSYAGYLGQNEKDTSIDGILLSEIRNPIFSQPYYDEDVDEVIFGVVAPATIGDKQGVLISSYNIKEFSVLLESTFKGGSSEIGIVNSKGEVVSGRDADEFKMDIFDSLRKCEFKSSSAEAMRTGFIKGESGFSIYSGDGIVRYCTYSPIGLNDWYVVVTIKESSLRGKLTNLERYGFQLTVELVIIMLGLLGVIIASWQKEQKKVRMILERAARIDVLTGVYNRKGTEETIDSGLLATGEDTCVALLVIDLDDFKKINDQGGHLFGDRVLKECANRLKCVFGEEGVVGRIGGDEFIVFLWDGWDTGRIEEKIDGLNRDFYVSTDTGEMQRISISVGIAQAEPEEDSFLSLYQSADAALYRAKQTGKAKLSD